MDPLPNKDRTGFGFSTVKALVRREKDEKSNSDCCHDEEFHYLTRILFDSGSFVLEMFYGDSFLIAITSVVNQL